MFIGGTYALPFYNHAGANLTYPTPCNCTTLPTSYVDDRYDPCNVFSFITGFIYFNTYDMQPMFEMSQRYSLAQINTYAYNASFVASAWGRFSPNYESEFNQPEYRRAVYEFCNTTNYTCSIVTFSSFDTSITNWAVSDYYYSLPTGACHDSFSTTQEYW